MRGPTAQILRWAREAPDPWWTAAEAARAVGAPETVTRSALAGLEAEGLVYRSVAVSDAWCLREDGRDAEAQARLEAASLCEENPR